MGSGLILLVIVGAWLAVLVPMALRSHDAATTLRSAERFGDAMRVLSPRSSRRSTSSSSHLAVESPPALEPLLRSMRDVGPRPPLTLAERRRRVLVSLLGGAALGLVGGLLTVWLLGLGVVLLALAAAYVVHLRRLAVAKAERSLRAAGRPVPDGYLDDGYLDDGYLDGGHVADGYLDSGYLDSGYLDGVPDRMPARPVPLRAPLPAPALRYEDPLPQAVGGWQYASSAGTASASGSSGSDWSPVPVPLPTYLAKPVAPPRPPRTIDLTQPGRYTDVVTAGQLGDEPDLELDDILEGRRAVGGW